MTGAGKQHRDMGRQSTVLRGWFQTPWGKGRVTVEDGHLARVELPPVACAAEDPTNGSCDTSAGVVLARWVRELEDYFQGRRLCWTQEDLALEAVAAGSFKRAVYAALLEVPAGATVSYAAAAEMAGYPRAARAVGNALAANPLPVVVPCHRVIRSDGSLGKYGNDPRWKERLLAHERLYASEEAPRP